MDVTKDHSKFVISSLLHQLETPENLFHFMNIIKDQGKKAVILSISAPGHLSIALKDLDSRLKACYVCELEAPDDDLLKALILKHAQDHQILIPQDVLNFLLLRMERSFKVAQDVVRQLAILSLRDHRPISIPFVKDVLGY